MLLTATGSGNISIASETTSTVADNDLLTPVSTNSDMETTTAPTRQTEFRISSPSTNQIAVRKCCSEVGAALADENEAILGGTSNTAVNQHSQCIDDVSLTKPDFINVGAVINVVSEDVVQQQLPMKIKRKRRVFIPREGGDYYIRFRK